MKRRITIAAMALLTLSASAEAYSLHAYRVRDAGPEIVHSVTLCTHDYDNGARFKLTARVEMTDGSDKRFRHATYRVSGCQRLTMYYDDVLRYRGRYWGKIKARTVYTDDVQYTPWRAFWSS